MKLKIDNFERLAKERCFRSGYDLAVDAAKAMLTTSRKIDMSERGIESLTKMGDRDVIERASKTKRLHLNSRRGGKERVV